MDIHKPKAAHSVREFLVEIGTIICGILIALGLEQTVEAVRRNTEVREAREALLDEIREDAARLQFGIDEDRCILKQLPAYEAWARGGPKVPELRTRLSLFRSSTWDTVKAGAVPHMPLRERLALASFYDSLANEQRVVEEQRDAAKALFSVNNLSAASSSNRDQILNAVSLQLRMATFYTGNARSLLKQASTLGASPPGLGAEERAGLDYVCGQGQAIGS